MPNTIVSTGKTRHLTYQELDILHSLRGFCAFYVVIYHAKYVLWSGGQQYLQKFPRISWDINKYILFALDMLSSAGFEMVIFFFVLSGFFIRYAQLRKHRDLLEFYLNRIVRIYPPYLVSVGLAALTLIVLSTHAPQAVSDKINRELNISLATAWYELRHLNVFGIIKTLFFMPVQKMYVGYNHVFWSLLPEALFYLLVPIVFIRIKAYYIISIIAYVVGLVLQQQQIGLNAILNYLLIYNMYFAVGAMLYDVVVNMDLIKLVKKVPAWILFTAVIFLFLVLIGLAIVKLRYISGIVASLLAILCISTLLADKVSSKNILIKLMHAIGIFSFSLYLYHLPLLLICYGLLVIITGDFVFYDRYYWLAVPLVTLACYGLYWITERVSVNYFRKV
ncbi:acyltransferase family protein [Hymenobacter volaticus]|uniref:Acyltransferase n=1 Tax=Hymenobacter volaticus TaxID=2932254 RepID=A0ABY4G8T7_9BACT|nr:acyltransferase [Hymenobacter volaticus]UOQ67233.1 acyltransferase [Hymenobacter volaticus]